MTDTEKKRKAATDIVEPDGEIDEFDRRVISGVYPVGLGEGEGTPGMTEGTVRQLLIAIDPEFGLSGTFEFADMADGNSEKKALTCAYSPKTKTDAIGYLQETIFFGTINAGRTMQAFREDLGTDSGTVIDGDLVTTRLDPSIPDTVRLGVTTFTKRFRAVSFPFVNPFALGVSVQVTKDHPNPGRGAAVWEDLVRDDEENSAGIETGLADWINLRVRDQTQFSSREVFGSFVLHYNQLGSRDREDDA